MKTRWDNLIRNFLTSLVVALVFALSMSACTYFSEHDFRNMSAEVSSNVPDAQMTQGEDAAIQGTFDMSEPLLTVSAQNAADFGLQAAEYMNDLIITSADLQGSMQSEFKLEDWSKGLGEKLNAYEAAVKKAMSIPKPHPQLNRLYDSYLEMIRQYERFAILMRKGIESGDLTTIKAAFAQAESMEKHYDRLMRNASGKAVGAPEESVISSVNGSW
ncbi:hypothetical protein P4T20_00740 [Aneurinibacillus thermoaerophilus]|nr:MULTISPECIES: hypothetical protein [Aneurinibacillus]MED0677847.1 hypothetical protein [Aneurinibacillus thermoaerophilus]